ncbi:hypothetical protein H4582DRAFT_2066489 [Lactarius indigo]|nr:hypothetical protein H4582DRAFT_2066489 [Lactarius indigo]
MHPTTSNKRKNDQNPTNPQKRVKPDVESGQVVDAAVAAAPSPAPSSPAPSIVVVAPSPPPDDPCGLLKKKQILARSLVHYQSTKCSTNICSARGGPEGAEGVRWG